MRFLPAIFNDRLDDYFDEEFVPTSFGSNLPATDIYQTKNSVVVKASLPGYKDDQIDISLEDNVLTVAGKTRHEEKEEDKDKQYFRKEIKQEQFSRSFRLPCMVANNPNLINATFKEGLLTVILPKAEEAKSKKIQIKK